MNDNHEWLNGLKEGNEVAIQTVGWGRSSYSFLPVTRITATQIKVGEYTKFRRKDGVEMGTSRPRYLRQSTPELKAEIAAEDHRNKLMRILDSFGWYRLSLEELESVYSLIEKHLKPKDAKC